MPPNRIKRTAKDLVYNNRAPKSLKKEISSKTNLDKAQFKAFNTANKILASKDTPKKRMSNNVTTPKSLKNTIQSQHKNEKFKTRTSNRQNKLSKYITPKETPKKDSNKSKSILSEKSKYSKESKKKLRVSFNDNSIISTKKIYSFGFREAEQLCKKLSKTKNIKNNISTPTKKNVKSGAKTLDKLINNLETSLTKPKSVKTINKKTKDIDSDFLKHMKDLKKYKLAVENVKY